MYAESAARPGIKRPHDPKAPDSLTEQDTMEKIGAPSLGRTIFSSLIRLLAAVLCLMAAFFLFRWGFNEMREARQIDRFPLTPIEALSEGAYAIRGKALSETRIYQAPYSGTDVLYIRYRLEETYKDSDDTSRVRVLESGEKQGRFLLEDSSGRVSLSTEHPGNMTVSIPMSYKRKKGDLTYMEWAIHEGDLLNLLGEYDADKKIFTFFTEKSGIPPLLTTTSLQSEGGLYLFSVSIHISLASVLVALAIGLFLTAVRVHRFWVYVLFMSLGMVGGLTAIGMVHLKEDWKTAAASYQQRYRSIQAAPSSARRTDLYAMRLLIEKNSLQWPDRPLFLALADKMFPLPEGLLPAEKERAAALVATMRSSYLDSSWMVSVFSLLGVFLGGLFFFRSFQSIKRKRLIEHIPTAKSQGLSYGLAELKGYIRVDHELPHIQSQLKGKDCVAYTYKIEEQKDSGDNKNKWVTVASGGKRTDFWLEDAEGRVKIIPENAEMEFPGKYVQTRGVRRYTEYWMPVNIPIYCIGFAGLDGLCSDQLTLQQGKNGGDFFFISHRKEEDLLISMSSRSFFLSSLGLGAVLFACTTLWSGLGWLTPGALFKLSLAVPLTLLTYTLILHYNDLIFLKNRVLKTWSDIDTILQKRADLWPQLQNIVQAALQHERELLTAIAALRSRPTLDEGDAENADRMLNEEKAVSQAFFARLETFPELKNQSLVQQFSEEIRKTENYLALLRQGYSDSVAIYNTRIQSFPDLILARLFGFTAKKPFTSLKP